MEIDKDIILILVGIYFIISGIIQIIKGKSYERYALNQGVVNASHTVKFAALAMVVLGSIVLIPSLFEYGVYGLCIYMIISALSIHKFWEGKEITDRVSEGLHFGKNIGIAILLYGMTV
jgi:uncharacterized membrane protein YphA (DoxX/SURF4 family)